MNTSSLVNNESSVTTTQYCATNANDIYDMLQKSAKVIATILYFSFHLLSAFIKEMRSRHMIYLQNLSAIGFVTSGFYGLTSFNSLCSTPSQAMCEYQAFFVFYTIYLSANGVMALSFYRLACAKYVRIEKMFSNKIIVGTVFVIWTMPIFTVILPAYALRIPVYFNAGTASCRMDLTDFTGFFFSYLILANILPSILILIIDVLILVYLITSKKRVHNHHTVSMATTQQSIIRKQKSYTVGLKLFVQLVALFLVFEIYAIANSILLFQTSTQNKMVSPESMKLLRVLRWWYHVLNPIIYCFMHPVIYAKLKETINKINF